MAAAGKRLKMGEEAPDFALTSVDGQEIRLSGYHGKKPVYLVLLRGFS